MYWFLIISLLWWRLSICPLEAIIYNNLITIINNHKSLSYLRSPGNQTGTSVRRQVYLSLQCMVSIFVHFAIVQWVNIDIDTVKVFYFSRIYEWGINCFKVQLSPTMALQGTFNVKFRVTKTLPVISRYGVSPSVDPCWLGGGVEKENHSPDWQIISGLAAWELCWAVLCWL